MSETQIKFVYEEAGELRTLVQSDDFSYFKLVPTDGCYVNHKQLETYDRSDAPRAVLTEYITFATNFDEEYAEKPVQGIKLTWMMEDEYDTDEIRIDDENLVADINYVLVSLLKDQSISNLAEARAKAHFCLNDDESLTMFVVINLPPAVYADYARDLDGGYKVQHCTLALRGLYRFGKSFTPDHREMFRNGDEFFGVVMDLQTIKNLGADISAT